MRRSQRPLRNPSSRSDRLRLWQRWGWTVLAGLFGLTCAGAGWLASAGTATRVRMSFVLLAMAFFLYGFFAFFFATANFSASERQVERKILHKPPPPKAILLTYLVLGFLSVCGMLALWWWRSP